MSENKALVEKLNYSIPEAAQASGLSVSTLYKLSCKREIPIQKVGSRVLIPIKAFEAWLRTFRVEAEK